MYIWKARNNKLFKGMDMDPLKTVWYAESECHAWFDANRKQEDPTELQCPEQTLITERCMID